MTVARCVFIFFFDNKACAYFGPRAKQWIQTQEIKDKDAKQLIIQMGDG